MLLIPKQPFRLKHRFITIQYDKRDDFDFDTVNFPFLDGAVTRRPSYGVYMYISQLIRFARASSNVKRRSHPIVGL